MSRIQFNHGYHHIISLDNLLVAWKEFLNGKRSRKDVQEFELRLMHNIISLHNDLATKTYKHSDYEAFNISDPKPRNIHKAKVRDRVLHRAVYRTLYPFFDRTFISDSFSCRLDKGTHKALKKFTIFHRKVSKNHTKIVWVLKCDIRKFFASIDQDILIKILVQYVSDADILWLLSQIISSFYTSRKGVGLPLGNLTSQLLVNVYMNEFDQYVKHELKQKHYIRYADDFLFMHHDKNILFEILPKVGFFLKEKLRLSLHPDKVFIKTVASGVDFLGWVHFPDHRILRTSTKKRMFRRLKISDKKPETVQSYLSLLHYGNTHSLKKYIKKLAPDSQTG